MKPSMRHYTFKYRSQNRGFTLIELLIVVAIIAVLSSIVLIGLGPTQRAGRDARRIADLRQVQTALELYFNKCGYYPGSPEPNPTCGGFSPITTWQEVRASLLGTGLGITQVPNDPGSGRNYYYGTTDVSGSGYVLGAQLEDQNNPALRDSFQAGSGTPVPPSVPCGTPGVYCVAL